MRMGAMVRRRRVRLVVAGLAMMLSACVPSIGPAPTEVPSSATELPIEVTDTETTTVEATATEVTASADVSTVTAVLPASTPEPLATTVSIECTVTARSLRLRSGPGTTFAVLGGLVNGQSVTAGTRNADSTWVSVRTTQGLAGWVSADFVSCAQPLDSLPLATPVP